MRDGAQEDDVIRPRRGERLRAGITRNVFVLGLVSFFTDISSEMIVPLRSIFLVTILQTPLPVAGLIAGIAESTASILKIVSGRLADRPESRKPLMLFGYGLSNAVKPLLALVTTWPAALSLIFLDRAGKGLRSSPRDAMLADSTPPGYIGKAFGFHRSMDTLGAAIGPLFAALILWWAAEDLRAVFAWTVVPGVLAVMILLLFVRGQRKAQETPHEASLISDVQPGGSLPGIAGLGVRFWMFTGIATLFALGNSADDFLFLRTAGLEQSLFVVPLIYFGYNVVYAALATPLGALSDRWGRLPVLISGYAAFALVYAGWAVATQAWNTWLLFLIYGIYAAATEGIARAFVTDLVPRSLRGSALGWFGGVTGLAALPSNVLAGWLWVAGGPSATFWFGAFMAAVSLALMVAWLPWLRRGFPERRVKEA
ncbi:MAG: MFS transporter [Chloroflexia bacterium]